jgi:hypothetical protein
MYPNLYNNQYIGDIGINHKNKIYFSKEKELINIIDLLDQQVEKVSVEKPLSDNKLLICDKQETDENYIESRVVEVANKEIVL